MTSLQTLKHSRILTSGPIAALLMCIGITWISSFLVNFFAPLNIVMIYLCGVVFIAYFFGRTSAFFASFLSVSFFDYFFVNPHFSIAVDELQYVFTFIVMFMVGILIGDLTARAKYQAEKATRSEQQMAELFDIAKSLSREYSLDALLNIAAESVKRTLGFTPDIYLKLPAHSELTRVFDGSAGSDSQIALTCFNTHKPLGSGFTPFFEQALQYYPIESNQRSVGVLVLRIEDHLSQLSTEQQQLINTQILLFQAALERHLLSEENAATRLNHETEKVRNTLLAGLSHDLRTPLTILFSQVEMLLPAIPVENQTALTLANTMRYQVANLTRLVMNILDMAKAESEGISLRKEWQSIEEIIGGALRQLQIQLESHPLELSIPTNTPLVYCDAILLERVMTNLLENSCKYADAGSPISVSVISDNQSMCVQVKNIGPAIPQANLFSIFKKFTRGQSESTIPGVGLGLSLCQTIIEAHDGQIWVDNLKPEGVCFQFKLPLPPMPQLEFDEEEIG